jgi:hypothetical protein
MTQFSFIYLFKYLKKFFVLPALPSNEKNPFDCHNSYNKGPNLTFFSFTESSSNSLLTIKFPKNHITSSYHRNLPKTTKIIFGHQRALGINMMNPTSLLFKQIKWLYNCLLNSSILSSVSISSSASSEYISSSASSE